MFFSLDGKRLQHKDVWRPGVDAMEEDEELQCDPSAYDCLHAFSVDWPSLSFDILRDDLGLTRKEFPHTLYCASGTQADQASKNFIRIMRLSNISGRKRKLVPEQLEDNEDDSDADEDEDDDEIGDCKSCIHLWTPTTGGKWVIDRNPFTGHTASVEDLQWSPSEDNVFASCSVDGRIAIWDCRENNRSAAAYINAHSTDVNVISWNRLRQDFSPVAHFQYHKKPITSIEWSPHDMSVLSVSSSDNQLTIWDFSLERDAEEEDEFKAKVKDQANAPEDLPPQLLFVHQGQKDLKELHWHSQIPGMIMSTSADGFNVFIPSNLEKTLAD
ncbi:Glutamate-rich WD repeat-containing protein 1 [Nymphaea thermarum]|nr:Glutamate-rich WD repeat-containing protein 1 [Nymphaea thermarum]